VQKWLIGKSFQEECELFKGTRLRKKIQPCDFGYRLSHLYMSILYSRTILRRRKYFSLVSAEKICGKALKMVDRSDLKEMGVRTMGRHILLLTEIQALLG